MSARAVFIAVLLALAGPAFADGERASLLERGTARFDRGDFAGALPLLLEAHALEPRDPDVALLLGITHYRLGQPGRAEPLLELAAEARDGDTAAAARIFLALIADARGEADRARAVLERAAQSPLLGGAALKLARASTRPVSLLFVLRPEFDSNVPLLPLANTPVSKKSDARADGDLLALFSLSLRPFRKVGLTLDETASYRQQFSLLDFSLFVNTIGPGYAWLGRSDRVTLSYAFVAQTLGRSFFALGHDVDAAYRRRLVRDFGLGVRYALRYRDYAPAAYQPFTGPSHQLLAEASWATPDQPWDLHLGYLFVRDDAQDPVYSAFGHGARLGGHVRFARIVELSATGAVVWRTFDVPDSGRGARQDVQIYADASLGIDVSRHVGVIVGASIVRNLSTVSDFDYLKVTAHAGVVVGWSGP